MLTSTWHFGADLAPNSRVALFSIAERMQEMWAFVPANLHGINRSKTPWAANRFVLTLDFLQLFWSARETDAF
jgi:hypothetical protein